MSTETITVTRWTCDVCGAAHDNPEADPSEIPVAWSCVAISIPDVEEPVAKDLCPACTSEVIGFLKITL